MRIFTKKPKQPRIFTAQEIEAAKVAEIKRFVENYKADWEKHNSDVQAEHDANVASWVVSDRGLEVTQFAGMVSIIGCLDKNSMCRADYLVDSRSVRSIEISEEIPPALTSKKSILKIKVNARTTDKDILVEVHDMTFYYSGYYGDCDIREIDTGVVKLTSAQGSNACVRICDENGLIVPEFLVPVGHGEAARENIFKVFPYAIKA